MKRKWAMAGMAALLFIYTLFLACVFAAADTQSEAQFIQLERGAVDEILADGNKATARFPVKLLGVKAEEVTLRIVDVVLGKWRESRLVNAFTPKLKAATNTVSQEISIEFEPARVSGQGTYSVAVEATTTDGAQRQLLDLQIIVPAAKLRPPGTVMVEELSLWIHPWSITKSPLELMEISGRSGVSNVTFSHLPPSGDRRSIDGYLAFESPTIPVPSYGKIPVTYELKGEFPFGTTKGAVEVSAPQLAEPLTINYEVHKRLSKGLILVVIIAGILCGWLARTKLTSVIQLNTARREGFDLRDRIDNEKKNHEDANFRSKLEGLRDQLNIALKGKKLDKMTTAIKDADTALREALDDLKAQRMKTEAKLTEIAKLTFIANDLPLSIQEPLLSTTGPLRQARQEIEKDDIEVAQQRLESIRADLVKEIQIPVTEWREHMPYYLQKLSEDNALLPPAVIQKMKPAFESLKPLLEKVTLLTQDANVEQITVVLKAIQTSQVNVVDLMVRLGLWLQTTAEDIIQILGGPQMPEPSATEYLLETITKFSNKAQANLVEPQNATKKLPNDLNELHNTWRDALLKQIPEAGEVDKNHLNELIEKRDYAGGARYVVQVIEEKKGKPVEKPEVTKDVAFDDFEAKAETFPAMTSALTWWFAGAVPAAEPRVVPRIERVEERYKSVATQIIMTERALTWAKRTQDVIAGILIAIVGYFLFAEKFVGTGPELATVFFWAFGIDISVDAVLGAAKGIKAPQLG